ncbi:MAG: isopentenyl transferase family protein, partial [Candidatus Heimdallarchaeaceae archaeon]
MKVDRIKIYGSTCSGKTSLAIQLSEKLEIPVYHLDDIFWEENWQEKQPEEFREEVENIVNLERWIIDGNYSRVKKITLPRTTLAIILNPSLIIVFWRLIVRSLARRGLIDKRVTRLPSKIKEDNRR